MQKLWIIPYTVTKDDHENILYGHASFLNVDLVLYQLHYDLFYILKL